MTLLLDMKNCHSRQKVTAFSIENVKKRYFPIWSKFQHQIYYTKIDFHFCHKNIFDILRIIVDPQETTHDALNSTAGPKESCFPPQSSSYLSFSNQTSFDIFWNEISPNRWSCIHSSLENNLFIWSVLDYIKPFLFTANNWVSNLY